MSKISELTDGGSLLPTDFLIAVRSGGNVKVQADDITVDQINLGDNEFIRLGNSQDLTMVHTSTQSIINQAGIGDLLIQKTGTTKVSITANGLEFPDNSKAIFGAGSDLQIYHDGSNSFIQESGTGDLKIRSNKIRMEAPDSQNMIIVTEDAGVQAFYNGTERLSVTNTGIDVTGTVTADGLTVDGQADFESGASLGSGLNVNRSGHPSYGIVTGGNTEVYHAVKPNGGSWQTYMKVTDGGDISFYEDTGTTESLIWDSSLTQLKVIGRETSRGSGVYAFDVDNSAHSSNLTLAGAMRVKGFYGDSFIVNGLGDVSFFDDSGTAKFFWDASAESLGIGRSSNFRDLLTVHKSDSSTTFGETTAAIEVTNSNASGFGKYSGVNFRVGSGTYNESLATVQAQYTSYSGNVMGGLVFGTRGASTTNVTERMRIDASGITTFKYNTKVYTAGYPETRLGISDSNYFNFTFDNPNDSLAIGKNGSTKMTLDASGNLLVGSTTLADVNNIVTSHLLEGASTQAGAGAVGIYNNTGTASSPALNVLNLDASTDSSNRFIQFYADVTSSGATAMGGIVGNGASNVQFAALSDAREKENITSITGSLDKITSLNPVEFDWIASGEHCNAGFVAQEVETIFPEFIVDNISSEGEEERKGLTGGMTGGIVAHLVKAIQEQQATIEALTARIAALES